MDRTYLQEAFKAMQALNEEDFMLDDAGIKDILDFQDHDELNDIVDVVDPEAETEEELEDTYIGKVILECEVCHSTHYKDPAEIVISEESDLANIEDECPICHSQDGFKIVGQVAPYEEDPELKVEVEDKPVDDDLAMSDEDVARVNEPFEGPDEFDDDLEESLNEDANFASDYDLDRYYDDKDIIKSRKKYGKFESPDTFEEDTLVAYIDASGSISPEVLKEREEKAKQAGAKTIYYFGDQVDEDPNEVGGGTVPQAVIDHIKNNEVTRAFIYTDDDWTANGNPELPAGIKVFTESLDEAKNDTCPKCRKKPCECEKDKKEEIKEGFEKVDLEMEDKIIHVSEEEKEPIPDAEMITPVSDELEAELLDPTAEIAPEEEAAPVEEVPMDDAALGDDFAEDDFTDEAGDEEIDYDVDDFDENEFDDLGESYLKKVYENVDSFKTTAVKQNENALIVEGMIKFNSGKEKPTKFVFEAKDATKSGKVRFIGENAQITRGKKAFTLAGSISEGKFIAESLNYNYRVNNNRVYGTVKING